MGRAVRKGAGVVNHVSRQLPGDNSSVTLLTDLSRNRASINAKPNIKSMNVSVNRTNYLLIGAVVLTLSVLCLPYILPDKTLDLTPNSPAMSYVYASRQDSDTTDISGSWIDQKTHKWHCQVAVQGPQFHCSAILLTTGSASRGVDFDQYAYLKLKVNYQGSGRRVRVGLRNYDPLYSRTDDPNSGKYHFAVLLREDLNKEIRIPLNDIAVAEWWVLQYNLPLSESQSDLHNVVSIAVELVDELEAGEHSLQVENIELVGSWVNEEALYAGIIIVWIVAVLIFVTFRMVWMNTVNSVLTKERNKYHELSSRDKLTGTLNRHAIEEGFKALTGSADNDIVACLLMDIDYFKKVNDEHGHETGDKVLRSFARVIQDQVRSRDIFGRWGGEEFVLICPSCNLKNAMAIAEKIRKSVAEFQFDPQLNLTITTSIGVCTFWQSGDYLEAIRLADDALYQAKKQGRNCIVHHSFQT